MLPFNMVPAGGGYEIGHSLRLRASASAYLSRTFGSPTAATEWTYSAWVKVADLTSVGVVLLSAESGAASEAIRIHPTSRKLEWETYNGSSFTWSWKSNMLFRDPSAWCHIVFGRNASNNYYVAVNGVEITSQATVSGLPSTYYLNVTSRRHEIAWNGAGAYGEGYHAETNFVDGQLLTANYFGETNADGVWVSKRYTGTYGNNGFYLDFSDGTSTTTLGYDAAGSNDWTLTNVSTTAGVTYDWMTDTPTQNYATLNPLAIVGTSSNTFADANLKLTTSVVTTGAAKATTGISFGKWYWEVEMAAGSYARIGIESSANDPASGYLGANASGYAYIESNGNKINSGSSVAYGNSYASTSKIGVAFDADAGKLWFAKDGTWQASGDPAAGTNAAYTTVPTGVTYFPAASDEDNSSSITAHFNFGQRPFAYTPPTGFKSLCTANLPAVAIPNPRKHFDVVTRAGTSATASVTSLQFQPDLLWGKSRGSADYHILNDTVRGIGLLKKLASNSTNAEGSPNDISGYYSAVSASGYTVDKNGTDGVNDWVGLNKTGTTYVDWLWKANGAGVTNTAGSITSTVSANTTAGFSIVTYTGTGANATVGHGLGVVPKLIIVKQRTAGTVENWAVYNANIANTEYLLLNGTAAKATGATYWNSTTPTSTLFSIGSAADTNESAKDFVAYCFAEIPGYSKFGSYVGNGSTDGPFVYCGFRPRYVLIKHSSSGTDSWIILDSSRNTYNVADLYIHPNASNAEASLANLDFTASGFKVRATATGSNSTGETYIFAAFAEHPFGGSNVSPSPAR